MATEEVAVVGVAIPTEGIEKGIKALDTLAGTGAKVEKAMDGVDKSAAKTGKTLAGLGQNSGKGFVDLGRDAEKASSGIEKVAKSSDAATIAMRGFAAVAATGLSFGAFIKAADAVTVLNNQLKLATANSTAAAQAYGALFEIAQRSRVSFTELGSTFASISRAGEALGVSQQRLLGVTEAISNAVTVSGGSAESARAALVQLSQGLASGTLRGDELNSVMEQTPRLAKALADGLGISTGQLRKLGEAGEITAEKVIKALESQSAVLKGEVASSIATVGQAWTQLTNASVVAVGEIDKATGTSATLASAMQGLAGAVGSVGRAFKDNETAITVTLGALGGAVALAGVGAMALRIGALAVSVGGLSGAFGTLTAVMAANPVILALMGLGAIAGAGAAYLDSKQSSIEGLKTSFTNLGLEIERTEKKIAAAGGKTNAAMEANLAQMRARQAEVKQAIDKIQDESKSGPVFNRELEREKKEAASYEKRLKAKKEFDLKYATSEQKLAAAIKAEREKQGDLFTPEAEAKLRAEFIKTKATVSDSAKAIEFYNDLVSKGSGYNADYAEKMGKLSLAASVLGLSYEEVAKQAEAINAEQPFAIANAKEFAEAQRDAAKAADDYNKAQAAVIAEATKEVDALQKSNAALALQNETIGLSTEKLNELVLSRQDAAISSLEDAVNVGIAMRAHGLYVETLDQEIEKLKELKRQRSLTAENQLKTRAAESIKKAADEAKRYGEQLENIISDGIYRGFENGKGIAENFRDVLENTFKTMILRPVIQATVAGGLSALGLPAAAQVSGGASNAGFLAAGLTGGFSQGFGATVSNGLVGGAAVNAGNIGALFSGGQYAAAVGAAAPYVIAAVAASALINNLINRDQGPQGIGVNSTFDAQGNLVGRVRPGNVGTSSADADRFTDTLASSYAAIAQRFGAKLRATTFGYQSTTDGKFDVSTTIGGSNVFQQGTTGVSEQAIQLAASRAVFAALQASELPSYLSKAFTGIVADSASQAQIDSALQFAEGLKAVRFGLLDASAQAAEYQKAIDAGTAALGTSAASFKTDFIAAIDAGLSPSDLANWQALGTNINGLAQVTPKAADAVAALGRSASDIANERGRLQDQLDSFTLSNTQLLDKQRAALDESNRALFDQVNTAQSAKDAADALAESQANLATTNTGLQERLDLLAGARTQRDIELASATDSTTAALLNQIYAAEDLKTAQEKAATAAQKLIDNLAAYRSAVDRITIAQGVLGGATSGQTALTAASIAVNNSISSIQTLLDGLGYKGPAVTENLALSYLGSGGLAGETPALQAALAPLLATFLESYNQRTAAQTALTTGNTAPTAPTVVDTSAADALARTNAGYSDQLALLLGTQTERSLQLRDATDESTKALLRQIFAQQDLKTSAENTAAITKEAGTLADRLAIATGSKTAQQVQRTNELAAALSDANRATLQAIFAAEDYAAAVDKAAQAAKSAADTALQNAKDATGAAFSSVQRAVDAQRKVVQSQMQVAQESVGSLKSIFDTLKGGINSLYGDLDSSGTSATEFLNNALATAQASGYLPDAGQLSDAVSNAISGTQAGVYATQADAEFAKLALAGTLTGLKDITGNQLTTAEQAVKLAENQLSVLDQTLANAQAQLDALNGVDTSVKTVEQAIRELTSAIGSQRTAQAVQSYTNAAQGAAAAAPATSYGQALNAAYGAGRTGEGSAGYVTNVNNGQIVLTKSGQVALGIEPGWSAGQIAQQIESNLTAFENQGNVEAISAIEEYAKARGIPGFAVGTNYVPENMLAMVHKGERITPAYDNPYNPANGGRQADSALLAELQALRKELAEVKATIGIGNGHQAMTAFYLDKVTEGGNATKTVVMEPIPT